MRKIAQIFPAVLGKKKTPWYLSGSIPAANCVAAYKAIGAASLAASYVNLANPGTYDCTAPTAAPTFAAATGWTFNGSTQYLTTGIAPANDQTWSMIARYSGAPNTSANYAIAGYEHIGGSYPGFLIAAAWGEDKVMYFNGAYNNKAPALLSGVLAIAGAKGYRNGVEDQTIGANTSQVFGAIYIGGANNSGTAGSFLNGTIQALAIYNAVLTAPQLLAIYTAIAALA